MECRISAVIAMMLHRRRGTMDDVCFHDIHSEVSVMKDNSRPRIVTRRRIPIFD
jgi:hypothetical protein